MQLYFCGCCGQSIQGEQYSITSIAMPLDDVAILAWQNEIRRECQHQPICVGPWQHAVRVVREEWAQSAGRAHPVQG